MDTVECPYCDHENEICHDDGFGYEEDEAYEQECDKCEKMFVFYTSISFNYNSQKAPCLNGGDHKWVKIYSTSDMKKERCDYCDEERTINK